MNFSGMSTKETDVNVEEWSATDTDEAKRLWAEYQRLHDVSTRRGQTVGIDPRTGRLWFGDSIAEVIDQRDADGVQSPLLFERVGMATYWRKGGRR
jgi:hypothetical protein